MMDTLNPDLSEFRKRGGKLIVLECTSDFAQSAAMGMQYYDSVVDTMGQSAVDDFLRLYVSAGTDHGCAGSIDPARLDADGLTDYGVATSAGTVHGVPRNVDWFDLLVSWRQDAMAPAPFVVSTANDPAPPFQTLASRPICTYPLIARYVGGAPAVAGSYNCRP